MPTVPMADEFATVDQPATLITATDAAQVWKVHLDRPAGHPTDPRWWRMLADAERERALRLAGAVEQSRFVVAHAALRAVLGRVCGVPGARLRLHAEAGGRPYLAPGAWPSVDFNLSHAGEWALVAVTRPTWRVGVDVERIRADLDYLGMAEHLYHPAELDRLSHTDPAERRACYFRLWCAKEAYVKAVGTGLAGLRDVLVRSEDGAEGGSVLSLSGTGRAWPVRWLDVAPGYAAAVVSITAALGSP